MTNVFSIARARTLRATDMDKVRDRVLCRVLKNDYRDAGAGTDSRDQPVPSRRCGSRSVAIPRASSPIVVSGLSFVNTDRTSLDVSAVQFLYRRLRRFIGGHLNETKPSRAISRSIDYYLGAVDFTCF